MHMPNFIHNILYKYTPKFHNYYMDSTVESMVYKYNTNFFIILKDYILLSIKK